MNVDLSDIPVKQISSTGRFRSLYSYMESTNERFRELPREQKVLALAYILSGEVNVGDVVQNIGRHLYYRHIPTISEFISEKYVPAVAHFYESWSPWKRDLEVIFGPKSTVREWILTGAIGTAKTANSCLAHFYNLFRITSMRYPQHTMGSDPGKEIVLQLMTVTLAKAGETLLNRFLVLLGGCPFYEQVPRVADFDEYMHESDGRVTPYCKVGDSIQFPNRIRIGMGSQQIHAIGSDLFGATLDEAEYRTGQEGAKKVETTFGLYSQLLQRIKSRFGESRYTLMTLVSSIGFETGVIVNYIKDIQEHKDNSRYVSQYAIWDIKTPNYDRERVFYVLRGNQRHPSRILTDEESQAHKDGRFLKPSGCDILTVPEKYRRNFNFRIEQSLRDLAGRYSIGDEKPFDELDHCVDNVLCPVLDLTAPLGGGLPLIDQFPDSLTNRVPLGRRLKRYPNAVRYAHWDLADTGAAGFTMLHKERDRDGRTLYVVDVCARIVSPDRISYEKISRFLLDLRDVLGIAFHTMTADSYQSVAFQQLAQTRKMARNVSLLSVDRNLLPYNTLSSVIAEDALRIGEMRGLAKELGDIYYNKQKPITSGRKDMADSLCGAVYNAAANVNDAPINLYYSVDDDVYDPGRLVPERFVKV